MNGLARLAIETKIRWSLFCIAETCSAVLMSCPVLSVTVQLTKIADGVTLGLQQCTQIWQLLKRNQLFRLSAKQFLVGKWSAVFSNHLCFLSSRIQLIFSVSHGRVLLRKCQALANSAHVLEARSKVSTRRACLIVKLPDW